jgi:PAS domain S-box-containing protein
MSARAQLIHELERRTLLLIESIQDYAIFMLDPDGVIVSWNPGAQRIKGYKADEIIGKHFSTFYPQNDIDAGKCEYELEMAGKTGRFEDENWRLRKDGSRFWANVVISAVRDHEGTLIGFAKVTRDLTERKRAEDDRAARLAAEQANRAKDEFLAILGHELRNPLAPITTAIQLLRLRGHDERELAIIERQANHLVRLVDDLLDVSRITQGRVELHREKLEMAGIVAEAIEVVEPMLEQRHITLALEVPPLGCAVLGDRARLVQVVSNLLTNAAKYSDPYGKIVVTASSADGWVKLQVRDQGIGIEPAMLDRIFETFVQQPQSAERAMGGLGLGLAIVRTLIKLHGGTAVARSDGLGTGAEFEISLPCVAAAAPVAEPPRETPPRVAQAGARRVLVVDDNHDAAALLAEVIAQLGHQVATAHDGPSALRVAAEFLPQLAILDIGLPAMDGYELAERLRAEPWAADLTLIALTGYGQQSARERSSQAGFTAHLVKPIDLKALEKLLSGD